MKLSLNWLREFVALDAAGATVQEITRRLTMAGLEVENIEHPAARFSDVFIAHVLDVKKHPDADRLHLCQVDAGDKGRFSVVCGAPNVTSGMTAALALVGAMLGEQPPLAAAMIRGVRSEGMLCSERELGLSEEHRGIISLAADAPLGAPVAEYLGLDDTVLDVAVLANRGDCLSILGLAREVSALFGTSLGSPKLRPLKVARAEDSSSPGDFRVELGAPELCPRYAALKMSGVKIGPSPAWMRQRLENCGMRPINNVVDVTNYVMLSLGQPLHAFDLDKIAAGKIIVRRAGSDREFVTLDGATRQLAAADLLIADSEKPLAIAGVMGGQNSEVSDSTSTILLESAYFEPMTVAHTARRLALRSEASYRFERGIDRQGQISALFMAAELLSRYADATAEDPIRDFEALSGPAPTIVLDLKRMGSLLGVDIPSAEVKRRLVALGAGVSRSAESKNLLLVVPPSYRSDLNEPADLAEEVARLRGLEDVPELLPSRHFAYSKPNREREFFRAIRELMLGAGFFEASTIAFVASTDNLKFPGLGEGEAVKVQNPLSDELREMRRSLLPGLIQALRFNLNRQAADFRGFEISKVFSFADNLPVERYHLAAVSYGDWPRPEVGKVAVQAGFFTIKGVLEGLFDALGIGKIVSFVPSNANALTFLHPGRSAEVILQGTRIGYLGEFHPGEAIERDLSGVSTIFELDLQKLIAYGFSPHRTIKPPPRFPAVRRDLALVIDRELPAERVIGTIREAAPELLESAAVFDVYEGESIAPGKKSLALALRYRAKDRTLTDEEVNRVHAALVERARARLGAELRQ